MFVIEMIEAFKDDLKAIEKENKKYLKKIETFLDELKEHPKIGTGKPEQLKGFDVPTFSRRITKKHRLVYQIDETNKIVTLISCFGHYE